ncbi:hypothetical protein RFI_32122 [Reticulomyxa filosa]|uniref:Uncharacterized protein n=1 Tax=Reticulomyxa filosa TaxID=46433 RepID=X6LTL7_RETFI|nr:hypothetical protein RFI_32122 [Reticulomyxa filosa]|eukprot:ETO05273.1 hypothetical protein RFI_32122 [Reticulomyxa filosa]
MLDWIAYVFFSVCIFKKQNIIYQFENLIYSNKIYYLRFKNKASLAEIFYIEVDWLLYFFQRQYKHKCCFLRKTYNIFFLSFKASIIIFTQSYKTSGKNANSFYPLDVFNCFFSLFYYLLCITCVFFLQINVNWFKLCSFETYENRVMDKIFWKVKRIFKKLMITKANDIEDAVGNYKVDCFCFLFSKKQKTEKGMAQSESILPTDSGSKNPLHDASPKVDGKNEEIKETKDSSPSSHSEEKKGDDNTNKNSKEEETKRVEYSLQNWPQQRGFTSKMITEYTSGDFKKLWKEIPLILPHEAVRFSHQLIRVLSVHDPNFFCFFPPYYRSIRRIIKFLISKKKDTILTPQFEPYDRNDQWKYQVWINFWHKWYWPFLRDHNKNEQDTVIPFLRRQIFDTIYHLDKTKTESLGKNNESVPTNNELEQLNNLTKAHKDIDDLGLEIHMLCHWDEQTKITSKFIQSMKEKLTIFMEMVEVHMHEEEVIFANVLAKCPDLTEKDWVCTFPKYIFDAMWSRVQYSLGLDGNSMISPVILYCLHSCIGQTDAEKLFQEKVSGPFRLLLLQKWLPQWRVEVLANMVAVMQNKSDQCQLKTLSYTNTNGNFCNGQISCDCTIL